MKAKANPVVFGRKGQDMAAFTPSLTPHETGNTQEKKSSQLLDVQLHVERVIFGQSMSQLPRFQP